MAKLYPPVIEGTIPACYNNSGTVEITVPYSMNRAVSESDFSGFRIKFKTVQSNKAVGEDSYLSSSYTTNEAIFHLTLSDEKWLSIGSFYKVQMAYVSTDGTIGYYSTVAILKYTSKPTLTIKPISVSDNVYIYHGVYTQTTDITEKEYSYCFNLKQNGTIVYSSGTVLHNNLSDNEDEWIIDDLISSGTYNIEYEVTTANNLIVSTTKQIVYRDLSTSANTQIMSAECMFDNGYIQLNFNPATSGETEFWLFRYNDKTKENKRLQRFTNTTTTWKDFTIEQGINYTYTVYTMTADNTALATKGNSIEVYADFEDMFLFDGERQLKVRFNPKVSSFKVDVLEQKQDTIGGTHPVFYRNGNTKYKEFPISGLISYQMDNEQLFMKDEERTSSFNLTSENIEAERRFKLEVLDWLNNGKQKLFKSPAEGNYIVRLMNISLSPDDKLNRMLHTFTATAYESADFNYTVLNDLGFINLNQDNLEVVSLVDEIRSATNFNNIDLKNTIEKRSVTDYSDIDLKNNIEYRSATNFEDFVLGNNIDPRSRTPHDESWDGSWIYTDNSDTRKWTYWNDVVESLDEDSTLPTDIHISQLNWETIVFRSKTDAYNDEPGQAILEAIQNYEYYENLAEQAQQDNDSYSLNYWMERMAEQQAKFTAEDKAYYDNVVAENSLWREACMQKNLILNAPAYAVNFENCVPGTTFIVEDTVRRKYPTADGSSFTTNNDTFTITVGATGNYKLENTYISRIWLADEDAFNDDNNSQNRSGQITYLYVGPFRRENSDIDILSSHETDIIDNNIVIDAKRMNYNIKTLDVIQELNNNSNVYESMNYMRFRKRKIYVLDYENDLHLSEINPDYISTNASTPLIDRIYRINSNFNLDPYGLYCIKNWEDDETQVKWFAGDLITELTGIEYDLNYKPTNLDYTIKINDKDFVLHPDTSDYNYYDRVYEDSSVLGVGTKLITAYEIVEYTGVRTSYREYYNELVDAINLKWTLAINHNYTSYDEVDSVTDKGWIDDNAAAEIQNLQKEENYQSKVIDVVDALMPSYLYIKVDDEYVRIFHFDDIPDTTTVYTIQEKAVSEYDDSQSHIVTFSSDDELILNNEVSVSSLVIGDGIYLQYSATITHYDYVKEQNYNKYYILVTDRKKYLRYKEFIDCLMHGFKNKDKSRRLVVKGDSVSENNYTKWYLKYNIAYYDNNLYFDYFYKGNNDEDKESSITVFQNFLDEEWSSENREIYNLACGLSSEEFSTANVLSVSYKMEYLNSHLLNFSYLLERRLLPHLQDLYKIYMASLSAALGTED